MGKLNNIHPDEILPEKFLYAMEVSQARLDMFGTPVQFRMGLQDEYELREARSAIKAQLATSRSPQMMYMPAWLVLRRWCMGSWCRLGHEVQDRPEPAD